LGMAPWAARASGLASAARSAATSGGLSRREMEVAELVARGRTNREIATALFVSERTAQTHVQHILAKLGFSKRSQIASWVTSEGRSGGNSGARANT
ncbi:MAG: response regulator transcription factor, partial [Nocardioidaceae bacterium]|nr:response regulator transcription factor [Nocardioidaceae bacterium]